MLVIPQMMDKTVPIGKDDSENVEVERFGEAFVRDYEIPYHALQDFMKLQLHMQEIL